MPFGIKRDIDGNEINFDTVYNSLIKPAIEAADMTPIRADEETVNGIIHKPMYERLVLCDYAVADLTTANANVFYELGIRHAVKPYTTFTLFSSNCTLPFDVNFLRSMRYEYDSENHLTNLKENQQSLTAQLLNSKKEKTTDSPVYQLVDGIEFQNSVAHEKTDIFRDKVKYDNKLKNQLAKIRNSKSTKEQKINAIDEIISQLVLENQETGILIDIMLSYRAVEAYKKMVDFVNDMPFHVQQTVMVQEQLGFALNRLGEHDDAIAILEKVIEKNGPSSETYGIMGRAYKDLFDKARKKGNEVLAESQMDKALETYLNGFEADWRDAYPGVNTITLLELRGDKKKITKLLPVVEYAVLRKLATKKPDYWDYATLLELAVIENDEEKAIANLKQALTFPVKETWMFDTTINNLSLIRDYREKRDENNDIPEKMISLLREQKGASPTMGNLN